jgi:hypothetical protein
MLFQEYEGLPTSAVSFAAGVGTYAIYRHYHLQALPFTGTYAIYRHYHLQALTRFTGTYAIYRHYHLQALPFTGTTI